MNELFVLGGRTEFDGITLKGNPGTLLHVLECGLDKICSFNGYKKNGDGCGYSILKECDIRVKILNNQSDIKEELLKCGWNTLCFDYGFKSSKECCSDILQCRTRINFERNLREYLSSKR